MKAGAWEFQYYPLCKTMIRTLEDVLNIPILQLTQIKFDICYPQEKRYKGNTNRTTKTQAHFAKVFVVFSLNENILRNLTYKINKTKNIKRNTISAYKTSINIHIVYFIVCFFTDSLMDVSQLVRYIYRRAHEHGLTAPVSMASMTYPNLHTVNLRKEFRKGQIADRDASMTYNHAMSFKRYD